MSKIDPHTDLLPDEQALLDGKTIEAPAPGTQQAADDDTGDESLDAAALAAIANKGTETDPPAPAEGAIEAPAPAPVPSRLDAGDPATFDATRTELLAKKADAMKQLIEGIMEPDEFAKIDGEVTLGLEQLTKNITLHDMNMQAETKRQTDTLAAIRDSATKVGIDYADAGIAALFDAKLRTVATQPDMQGKSASELYQATHKEVLKLFGKDVAATPAPAPAPAAAAAPTPAPKPTIPPTLGAMPNAAPVNVGQDLTNTIMSMDNPDDAEAMMSRMPPSQRESVLRATMPATASRRH